MLRQLSLVLALSMLPFAAYAQEAANGPLKPFTVSVVDLETGEPITDFEYRFYVAAPFLLATPRFEGETKPWPWTRAETKDGTVTLQLPPSCRFRFYARAHSYVYDHNMSRSHVVRTTDKERTLTHTLLRGITVSGRIIDFETKKPIENARVTPMRFYCPDHELSVFSDAEGRFSISGIPAKRSYVRAEHPEYLRSGWSRRDEEAARSEPTDNVVIELKRGESAYGIVLAPDGTPIEDAEIESYDGRTVKTDTDGTFHISGKLRDSGYDISIEVKKPGYMDFNASEPEVPEGGFHIVLTPLFDIRGLVLDPDGKPIREFTVMTGPGKTPSDYKQLRKLVEDNDGRFSIGLDTGRTGHKYERIAEGNWFTIKAEGYALYEDWIAYDPKGVDLNIKLDPGVSVEGSLSGIPKNFGGGEIVLLPDPLVDTSSARCSVPRPRELSPTQAAGKLAATIAPDGTFNFNGVRAGDHEMTINGKGITHARLTVTIPDKDTIIDPIEITASGRIEGQAFDETGAPWVFNEGCLFHKEYDDFRSWSRSFMTDEDGRFVLENVPSGWVDVGIVRQLSSDRYSVDTEKVNVSPGETTKVVFNNPESDTRHDVQFRIKIGDGSQAQRESGTAIASKRWLADVIVPHPKLSITLDPMEPTEGRERRGCRQAFDPSNTITIGNVEDGEYRVRVFDSRDGWCDGETPLYEGHIDVKADVAPIDIQLGAGAITGRLNTQWKPMDRFTVAAIKIDEGNRLYSGHTETSGVFCVRFLPPGEYVLYCVERANGYCRTKPIRIADNLVDIGDIEAKQGVTLQGEARFARRYDLHATLEAINEQGFKVVDPRYFGVGDKPFSFTNIPPGTWTLRLVNEDEVIESETVKIEGTDTIEKDIVAK